MNSNDGAGFDPNCRRCPRLATYLDEVRAEHPAYHARPVPAFGDAAPRLLIVGLAPGYHGANATGRPFTGDYAGILLYETLHALGLASAPASLHRDDGLTLSGCRITNAVKCLPPANKPMGEEIRSCNRFLAAEIEELGPELVVFALGRIAHDAVLRAKDLRPTSFHEFDRSSSCGCLTTGCIGCPRASFNRRTDLVAGVIHTLARAGE